MWLWFLYLIFNCILAGIILAYGWCGYILLIEGHFVEYSYTDIIFHLKCQHEIVKNKTITFPLNKWAFFRIRWAILPSAHHQNDSPLNSFFLLSALILMISNLNDYYQHLAGGWVWMLTTGMILAVVRYLQNVLWNCHQESHDNWWDGSGNGRETTSHQLISPLVPHMRQWIRSALVQIVTFLLPSLYLNQCWVIVNWTLRNKFQWNFNQNTKLFIHENASQNIVCEIMAILPRRRWVSCTKLTKFQHAICVTRG